MEIYTIRNKIKENGVMSQTTKSNFLCSHCRILVYDPLVMARLPNDSMNIVTGSVIPPVAALDATF